MKNCSQQVVTTTVNAAGAELIQSHLGLATKIARQYSWRSGSRVKHDDLVSAAYVGLTEAAVRFDHDRGEPFAAFARRRIRGAILDELRKSDVLTRRGREKARRLDAARRDIEAREGRAATLSEVADELGMSVADASRSAEQLSNPRLVAFDEHTGPSSAFAAPDQLTLRGQQLELLTAALAKLPTRDQTILSLSYVEQLSLREIGDALGVTESRISQLRTRALSRLRTLLAD